MLNTIYLAGGCFWGIEAYISQIKGVTTTTVGYGNGTTENPSYEEVCNFDTKHAEIVKVEYNPEIIKLNTLLEKFFRVIDPIAINRQGNDIGDQYRTGIYYTNKDDEKIIESFIKNKQKEYKDKIATEIKPLKSFFKAEEYHQMYLEKNPNGYCHINLNIE